MSWNEEAVHSLQGGDSHDFKLDSSLKLYPGQTLRFPLPSLAVSPEAPPGGAVDFLVSVSTFPKPDYQNRITLLVEDEYPADELTAVVDHQETGGAPIRFTLSPNYPNPFNRDTLIRFSLPTGGEVELAIYNLAGQKVTTLVDGQREAGTAITHWDGRDDQKRELASGVYLYRLRTADGEQVETRKLLLLH